jgi:hypothetical protein
MDTAKILLAVPARKLPSAALIKSNQLMREFIGLYPYLPLPRGCVAIPFMVREPHHQRYCPAANSSTYPFALRLSKGSEGFTTQPPRWEKLGEGSERYKSDLEMFCCGFSSESHHATPSSVLPILFHELDAKLQARLHLMRGDNISFVTRATAGVMDLLRAYGLHARDQSLTDCFF